ncbi:DUF742 domain-containing protein [Streptomyces solisilvae]|uniref:DUF742 domain-containing protein n=1 Tax=Streptomyces malaysiensis TaxID=92644 RepID=UPI0036CA2F8F
MADSLSVRPYAVAGGRTHSSHSPDLALETVVEPGDGPPPGQCPPEAEQILRLCGSRRRSIAELSGMLHQPVLVVQVLVGDLLDAQALLITASVFRNSPDDVRAVLEGLKRKWPDAAKSKAG